MTRRLILIIFIAILTEPTNALAENIAIPLRAEFVSPASVNATAIKTYEGDFGRLGFPRSGSCTYSFNTAGKATIIDSTGNYDSGEVSPDGCFAPDVAEMATFELQCPKGDTLDLRINSRSEINGIDVEATELSVEGGDITQIGDRYRLNCSSNDGRTLIRPGISLTLTPEAGEAGSTFGALELETEY